MAIFQIRSAAVLSQNQATPPSGWATYTPPAPSPSATSIQQYNEIVSAFYNWIGSVPGYGQGGESNTTAISYITQLLTNSGDFTFDQLVAAQTGLQNALNWSPIEDANNGNTSAMQASTPRYAATVLQSIDEDLAFSGTPFNGLTGTASGQNDGWYYAADPNNPNFSIGYNIETGAWDFENATTGAGVVKPRSGVTDDLRCCIPVVSGAFGDAPAEGPPSETYDDAGLIVGPSNGVQVFSNTGTPSLLLGNTGVLTDAGDASAFLPPGGGTAGVIGGAGSISQTLSGLQAGQWYAISFQAMTSIFDELAAGGDQAPQDLGDQAAAPQTIQVSIDGQDVGVFSTGAVADTNPLSATSPWQEFATAAFLGAPGNHTVTFTGVGPDGDSSSISLTDLQLLNVTPVGPVSVPSNGVSSLTPQQISALNPIVLIAANDSDLQSLNQRQFQAITPQQLAFFWGSTITRFTQQQLGWLTPGQIAGLGSDQIEYLGSALLNSFNQAQLQALPTLSTISQKDLSDLTTGTLSQFSAQQDATLTRAQLGALTAPQLLALNAGVWPLLNAAQVNGLTALQLAALSQTTINSIAQSALPGLLTGGGPSILLNTTTDSSPMDLSQLVNVAGLSTSGNLAAVIGPSSVPIGGETGNTSGSTAYFYNGQTWSQLAGNWNQVLVAPDGSLWGISTSGSVERYVVNQWVNTGITGTNIAAGSNGSIYLVGSTNSVGGDLYQWSGGQWIAQAGNLSSVAVGSDGTLWGIGTDGNVYEDLNGTWTYQNLAGTSIAAGGDGDVIVLGATNVSGGNAYQWSGNGTWTTQSQTLQSVEIDGSGLVYGVDSSGYIWQQTSNLAWITSPNTTANYLYYGSANQVQAESAEVAWNLLNTVAQSFASGAAQAQAAGTALTSALDAIQQGESTVSQNLIFNGITNTIATGNAAGTNLGNISSGAAESGAATLAALIGALIQTGGYAPTDDLTLSFLSVGGALTGLQALTGQSLSALASAIESCDVSGLAQGDLASIAEVDWTVQSAGDYGNAAATIQELDGSNGDGTAGLTNALATIANNENGDGLAIASLSTAQVQDLSISDLSTLNFTQIQSFSAAQSCKPICRATQRLVAGTNVAARQHASFSNSGGSLLGPQQFISERFVGRCRRLAYDRAAPIVDRAADCRAVADVCREPNARTIR